MYRKLVLSLVLSSVFISGTVAAENNSAASQWIAPDALLTIELKQPDAILDRLYDPAVTGAITALPVYQQAIAQPQFQQFFGVIRYLETVLATDWKTGLRKLVGGGITLAVRPGGATLLMVDSRDEAILRQLHQVVLGFVRDEAAQRGQPDRTVPQPYRGVDIWPTDNNGAYAIVGNRLLIANRRGALAAALDQRAGPGGVSLASVPAYQAAQQAAGANAVATAFVNLALLKQHPPVQQALTQNLNPLAALLFAGAVDAARESDWFVTRLRLDGNTLAFDAMGDGRVVGDSGPAMFALPREPGAGALPNLNVPRRIAGFSFYRDLHGFYAAKDELFPERTSGLIFFENMMGIFFTGRDLTEEVLAETLPEVRLVVAEQDYDPDVGVPQVQFPAFAAVFRLRNPDQFGAVAEEAWQKALGLINFTRGQQAEPGLIIDRPVHGNTKFTVAYFSAAGETDRANLDVRFNFRPALALVEDYVILSSTEGLTRDLIDALKKEAAHPVKRLAHSNTQIEISGTQLASILRANRESLVRQNMVGEGNTREQAETETGLYLTLVEYLRQIKLDFGIHDGRATASLKVQTAVPTQQAPKASTAATGAATALAR